MFHGSCPHWLAPISQVTIKSESRYNLCSVGYSVMVSSPYVKILRPTVSRPVYMVSNPNVKVKVMLRQTVSRPVYLAINPIWCPWPDFSYCQTVAGFMWGFLSEQRTGLSFTISPGPRQRSHSRVRVPRDTYHILLSQIRDSLNLESQVPLFISHRNRVAQALGSLFVASYDSQSYNGGIRTRFHTGGGRDYGVAPSPMRLTTRVFFFFSFFLPRRVRDSLLKESTKHLFLPMLCCSVT
jgi:hypothetical protein